MRKESNNLVFSVNYNFCEVHAFCSRSEKMAPAQQFITRNVSHKTDKLAVAKDEGLFSFLLHAWRDSLDSNHLLC